MGINETDVAFHHTLITATTIIQSISFFGVLINAFAFGITFSTDLRTKPVNLLIGNMAIADFGSAFFFFAVQPYFVLRPEVWDSQPCAFLGYVQFVVTFESVTFIPILAINRYMSLYHNDRYGQMYTRNRVICMIVASWLAVICVVTPYYVSDMTKFDRDNMHCCVIYTRNLFWDTYYLVCTFTPILIADLITVFANFKIYQKLRTHVSSNTNVSSARDISYKEIQVYTILDVIIPVVCLMPYFAVKYAFADREELWHRVIMTCVLLCCPIFRGVNLLTVLRPYRQAVKHMASKIGLGRLERRGSSYQALMAQRSCDLADDSFISKAKPTVSFGTCGNGDVAL